MTAIYHLMIFVVAAVAGTEPSQGIAFATATFNRYFSMATAEIGMEIQTTFLLLMILSRPLRCALAKALK